MSFKTRLSVLLLSTPVLAFVLIGGTLGSLGTASAGQEGRIPALKVFDEVISLVLSNYVEEVKVDKAMEGALRGLAEGLDPDSAYLDAEQVRQLETGGQSAAGDVGVELTRQYYLRIIAARDVSPAAKAGLQTGDHIRAIDGKPTRDLSVFEGDRLLRGQPGSKVTLLVIRGNAADPHEVTLVREKPVTPQVTARLTDKEAGYIRIPAFTASTATEVHRHAGELAKAGAKALVIDLRRTAEGDIQHGVATARLFVKSGVITSRGGRAAKGQDAPRETISAAAADGQVVLPVTLLMSAGTSGAAEVFAAALKGNKRAELVGEHTIGRAAAQRLVKLPEGRGLWLTYARYHTPTGEPIHGTGLKPDVAVDEPDLEFGVAPLQAEDPMLKAALERIQKSMLLIDGKKSGEPESPQMPDRIDEPKKLKVQSR
jgi:carboxyl-terminal processing protease